MLLCWSGVEGTDDVGVDLVERYQRQISGAYRGLETASVFLNVFAGVPVYGAEIQSLFAFDIAYAAGARAEAVDQPWDFCEGWDLEYAYAVRVPLRPNFFGWTGLWVFGVAALPGRCFRGGHGLTSIIAVGSDGFG